MSDIGVILQAIDFIEANLTEEITVADMADSVSFSLFHFSRTFSRVIGHPPYDYLMRRRLCEAARCLLEGEEKITDIAFRYGFNAPETFSRAFKRMFNLQPRQVKSGRQFDHRRLMDKPRADYLEYLNSEFPRKPGAKRIDSLQIAGIADQINPDDTIKTVSSLWNSLAQDLQPGPFAVDNRDCYGVLIFYPSFPKDRCMYLAGIALREGEKFPSFFVQQNIPAMDYACFELSERPNAPLFTRNYVHHTWWPRATNAGLPRFEIDIFSMPFGRLTSPLFEVVPKSIYFPLANN